MFNWLIFQENLENQAVIEVKENQDRKNAATRAVFKTGHAWSVWYHPFSMLKRDMVSRSWWTDRAAASQPDRPFG
ncbi:hypothetical protein [Roseovarius sp. D0-M9]|uniref:hypothetical protein n=1 Tax=Roseovarius sp. D0-M9 TaxID=3127117 RepID=UPI0030102BD8